MSLLSQPSVLPNNVDDCLYNFVNDFTDGNILDMGRRLSNEVKSYINEW